MWGKESPPGIASILVTGELLGGSLWDLSCPVLPPTFLCPSENLPVTVLVSNATPHSHFHCGECVPSYPQGGHEEAGLWARVETVSFPRRTLAGVTRSPSQGTPRCKLHPHLELVFLGP